MKQLRMRGVRRIVGNVVFSEQNAFRHSCCFYYLGTCFVFTPQMLDYLKLIRQKIQQLLVRSSLFLSSVLLLLHFFSLCSPVCIHQLHLSCPPSSSPMTIFLGGHWANLRTQSDFTCRRIYERRGGAMAHWYLWYTYITGSLTGVLSDVCLS